MILVRNDLLQCESLKVPFLKLDIPPEHILLTKKFGWRISDTFAENGFNKNLREGQGFYILTRNIKQKMLLGLLEKSKTS